MSCPSGPPVAKDMERLLPKDCESQVKMGITIIQNAFKAKVKSLESDLRLLTSEHSAVEEKLSAANQRIQKYERERCDIACLQERTSVLEQRLIERTAEMDDLKGEHRRREAELVAENKRFAEEIAFLKRKVTQFDSVRRMLWETMNREEDSGSSSSLFPENKPPPPVSLATTTTTGGQFTDRSPFAHDDSVLHSGGDSDGRKLFRLAKSRLPLVVFERFVDCVRRMNLRTISPEEAIEEVEKICGPENATVLHQFRALLQQRRRSEHRILSPDCHTAANRQSNKDSIGDVLIRQHYGPPTSSL